MLGWGDKIAFLAAGGIDPETGPEIAVSYPQDGQKKTRAVKSVVTNAIRAMISGYNVKIDQTAPVPEVPGRDEDCGPVSRVTGGLDVAITDIHFSGPP
jgi:hypothetical protein